MSEPYLVKPDRDFIHRVLDEGGEDLKKCFQCATCSVVCDLSDGRKPFPRKEKIAERLFQAAFERKVIIYKATGLAGTDGDAFLVAPPFIITEEEMHLVVNRIEGALIDVLS